jgi:hypothetical protein
MKKSFPNSLYPKIPDYEIWFRSQNKTVLISKVVLARSGHDIFAPKVSILKSSTQDKRPYKNRLNSRFLRSDLDFFECFWRTCLATFEGLKMVHQKLPLFEILRRIRFPLKKSSFFKIADSKIFETRIVKASISNSLIFQS